MLNYQRVSKNGGFFRSSNEKLRDFSRVDSLARSAVEELLAEFTSPSFLKAEMWLLDPLKKNLENVLDQNFGWFTRNFEYIVKKMPKISSVFFCLGFWEPIFAHTSGFVFETSEPGGNCQVNNYHQQISAAILPDPEFDWPLSGTVERATLPQAKHTLVTELRKGEGQRNIRRFNVHKDRKCRVL